MTTFRRVPWLTVLPLAMVAAFGSEFWVVAVRGAVGATERTSGPFAQWLGESAITMPLYVVALLVALAVAKRWFGPGPLRAPAVMATLLLVVIASTVVAISLLALDAVKDYHLEMDHLVRSASHGTCVGACFADQHHLTVLLQIRALGLGACVTLVSNLVLLGLVVAFRGGRLDVSAGTSALNATVPGVAVAGHEVLRVVPRRVRERLHRLEQDLPVARGELGEDRADRTTPVVAQGLDELLPLPGYRQRRTPPIGGILPPLEQAEPHQNVTRARGARGVHLHPLGQHPAGHRSVVADDHQDPPLLERDGDVALRKGTSDDRHERT